MTSMAEIRAARRQRFIELMDRFSSNQRFADAVDLAPSFVSQIKSGRRNVGDGLAREIEKRLKLPTGWMDRAYDVAVHDEYGQVAAIDAKPYRATEGGDKGEQVREYTEMRYAPLTHTLPVLNYIQAGHAAEVVDDYERGAGLEEITIDQELAQTLGSHSFALIVDGLSMSPDFKPGDRVIVDPDAPVRPGDIVVAKLDREEAATLKKFRDRGADESGCPMFELVPLNDDFPTIMVNAANPGTIVGPVVEHRKRLR